MEKPNLVCMNCGSVFLKAKNETPGSIFIEILLWLFFLLPGLIYSVWRLTSRHKICPFCGAKNLVPENSPAAQRLLQKRA